MEKLVIILVVVALFVVVVLFVLKVVLGQSGQTEEWLPYKRKQYFFTRSEQELFRILKDSFDPQRFAVFPKVRLGDFIEVDLPQGQRTPHWNRIKSRHVDFLIWDIEHRTIKFAIELDGNSHNSVKAKAADDFKNKLYETIQIELVRIRVGTDFATQVKALAEKV